jgi:hypothetical protein
MRLLFVDKSDIFFGGWLTGEKKGVFALSPGGKTQQFGPLSRRLRPQAGSNFSIAAGPVLPTI